MFQMLFIAGASVPWQYFSPENQTMQATIQSLVDK
jgi:hypothetical protein